MGWREGEGFDVCAALGLEEGLLLRMGMAVTITCPSLLPAWVHSPPLHTCDGIPGKDHASMMPFHGTPVQPGRRRCLPLPCGRCGLWEVQCLPGPAVL